MKKIKKLLLGFFATVIGSTAIFSTVSANKSEISINKEKNQNNQNESHLEELFNYSKNFELLSNELQNFDGYYLKKNLNIHRWIRNLKFRKTNDIKEDIKNLDKLDLTLIEKKFMLMNLIEKYERVNKKVDSIKYNWVQKEETTKTDFNPEIGEGQPLVMKYGGNKLLLSKDKYKNIPYEQWNDHRNEYSVKKSGDDIQEVYDHVFNDDISYIHWSNERIFYEMMLYASEEFSDFTKWFEKFIDENIKHENELENKDKNKDKEWLSKLDWTKFDFSIFFKRDLGNPNNPKALEHAFSVFKFLSTALIPAIAPKAISKFSVNPEYVKRVSLMIDKVSLSISGFSYVYEQIKDKLEDNSIFLVDFNKLSNGEKTYEALRVTNNVLDAVGTGLGVASIITATSKAAGALAKVSSGLGWAGLAVAALSFIIEQVLIWSEMDSGNGFTHAQNWHDHGLNDWHFQMSRNRKNLTLYAHDFSRNFEFPVIWKVTDGWFTPPKLYIGTKTRIDIKNLNYVDLSPNGEFNYGNKILFKKNN